MKLTDITEEEKRDSNGCIIKVLSCDKGSAKNLMFGVS